jgi:hypothetical protein
LSFIVTTTDIEFVDLREAPDVGQLGQDHWLTNCDSDGYLICRMWAASIREWAPDAGGFIWRSRRNLGRYSAVLFEDRLPTGPLDMIGESLSIDAPPAEHWVAVVLSRHNVAVSPTP